MSLAALLPLAGTRENIAKYVGALLIVYIVLIFIRILMSYLPRVPYNRALRATLDFVTETTDPYLNLFRRFLPMVRVGGVGLDLSPTIGVLVLFLALGILVPIIEG